MSVPVLWDQQESTRSVDAVLCARRAELTSAIHTQFAAGHPKQAPVPAWPVALIPHPHPGIHPHTAPESVPALCPLLAAPQETPVHKDLLLVLKTPVFICLQQLEGSSAGRAGRRLPVHCSRQSCVSRGSLEAGAVLRACGRAFHRQKPNSFAWGKAGVKSALRVTPSSCPRRKVGASRVAFAIRHHQWSGIFHRAAETPFPAGGLRSVPCPAMLSARVSVNHPGE